MLLKVVSVRRNAQKP